MKPREFLNNWKGYLAKFYRVIVTIWQLLKPFHGTFKIFVAFIVLYESLQIAEGYVLSGVIKLYSVDAPLWSWVSLIVVLAIYDEIFMRLDNRVDSHIILKILNPVFRYLKLKSVQKFLDMDMAWHQSNSSGTLVGKVNDGVWKITSILEGWCWEFVPTMIQASLSLIPILFLSPWVAVVAGAAFMAFMVLTVLAYNERDPLRKRRHDLYEKDWQQSDELVQSVETSVMFNQRERLMREYSTIHSGILDCNIQETEIGIYKYNRWRIRVLSLARRSILVIWICQLQAGTLDIAGLVFVNVLVEKLFHSFWRFGKLFDRTAEASEAAKRLDKLIAAEPSMCDPENPIEMVGPLGITFENVDFRYPGSENGRALNNLTFEIEPGKNVALVGCSGGGKTTIRKVLMRLFDIDSGSIKVGGVDIRNWSQEHLRSMFACVPQGDDVYIFDDTIARNIMFPDVNADMEVLKEATRLAGLSEFIESLPQKYETEVGERGVKLSGGQKQRVALARAILADRPILILDEATSSVDAITEREIQTSLREVLKDRTTIIIAHRLSTIRFADKIIVLDHGTKVEEGTHEELVSLDGRYAEMVKIQSH